MLKKNVKKFSRKIGLPGKTGISLEPRNFQNFFFLDSFPINLCTSPCKKIKFLTYDDLSCPEAKQFKKKGSIRTISNFF
jgi:hypothetical protein